MPEKPFVLTAWDMRPEVSKLTPTEFLVYWILAHYHTMQNGARPSIATIAMAARKRPRQISYALTGLKKKCYLVTVSHSGKSNEYKLQDPHAKNCKTPMQKIACKKLQTNNIEHDNIEPEIPILF